MKTNWKSYIALILILMAFNVNAAGTAADAVMVHNPYARAVPPGQPNSAAFMHLKNSSDKAHAIVNAISDVSKVVELHTHTMQDGMMMMRRIEKIDIPANGDAMLKPGGLHIMFIGLKQDLKLDQQVSLTLEFEDGSKKTVKAPVKKIMMGGMMKGMKH